MRSRIRPVIALAVAALAATTLAAGAAADQGGDARDGDRGTIGVELSGFQEDPATVSTTGGGRFTADVDERAREIGYTLTYRATEGTVTQSHIHFGGVAQAGGISVFLCSNLGNGPAGTQSCPPAPATISGTIRPVDVIGPVPQGISAGEFESLAAAIRAGKTYVNVHSTLWPAGEIRAQLDHHHH